MRPDLIVICYVDDLGLQAPKKQIVDKLIENLQKMGFELTRDGTFSEYLGIMYTTLDDGSINMTQQGLIQKIMDAADMQDCNPNRTPSTKEALGLDPDGSSMDDSWNYRSVVGMLLYLATNTRPDIAFAVSQVARFSHYPKKSHATAVKTIIRYLSGTKSNGVIFKQPTNLVWTVMWTLTLLVSTIKNLTVNLPLSSQELGTSSLLVTASSYASLNFKAWLP